MIGIAFLKVGCCFPYPILTLLVLEIVGFSVAIRIWDFFGFSVTFCELGIFGGGVLRIVDL